MVAFTIKNENNMEENKDLQAPEDGTLQNDIDYKAELEKEKQRTKQAEFTIEKLKKDKQQENVDEDKLSELIEKAVESRMSGVARTLSMNQAVDIAKRLSGSQDEADLILYHYQNTIIPTGNVLEDMENAHILANKAKLKKVPSEIQRANNSNDNSSPMPNDGGQRPPLNKGPVYASENEKRLVTRYGLVWDEVSQSFVKPKR